MDLVEVQEELKAQIDKLRINFKKCSKERLTRQYIDTRLQALESKYKEFTRNHVELIKNRSLVTNDYFSDDAFGNVEEFYLEFKTELKEKLEKFSVRPNKDSSFNTSSGGEHHSIKLPKITLPTFSGKYMEWPTFHDLFESLIHENPSLSDVERLHYLKTHLSNEAEQLLRHIPITANNYEQCWKILKARYNNKRYIANCILTRLVGQKSCSTESSHGVKQILDTTSDCLNALSNIGVDVSSWDIIIIHLTALKLDTESRKQWEQKISDHSDVLPTLKEFKSFLESRFRALEFLEPARRENTKEKVEKTKAFTVTATQCPFCAENHLLYQCKEFCNQSSTARREFVERKRLCFNCFGDNHPVYRCKRNTVCKRCSRKHHSLLHPEGPTSLPTVKNASTSSELESVASSSVVVEQSAKSIGTSKGQDSIQKIATHFANNKSKYSTGHVMLATALVKVNCRRNSYTLRALLDQGSQASFISEYAVKLLALRKEPVNGLVSGLGGDQLSMEVKYRVTFEIQSIHNNSCRFNIQAYVLTKLSSTLPAHQIEIADWPEMVHLPLADPGYSKPQGIDVLLGAEIYGQILVDGLLRNPDGTLTAQNTMFGWILSGRVLNHSDNNCFNNIISMHIQDESVNTLLRKFWELETEVPKELMSEDDEKCEAYYCLTTTRDDNGRYSVKLPFREANPKSQYGEFKTIAERRLKALEKKFEKNYFLKEEYTKAMNDYITSNHMERITDKEEIDKPNCVYLPHHAVIRDDKQTTKVRIVFDAACKGIHGRSLNDDLLVGPRLQSELRHLIMRWRTHPICFTADIIKMYRQIMVDKADTDFQRLLWRADPDSAIEVYRMLRVTFGVASAPYLAVKTLQQIAKDEGHAFPQAAEIVAKDFYMDDCLSGCKSDEEAIEIYHQMVALLKKGGFELQKWMSNSSKLMEVIHGSMKTTKSLKTNDDEVVKILGLSWNANKDVFQYTVKLPKQTKPVTKRVILSDISRLFDPLGWIAPVVIQAKIYMQKLWLKGLSWDEEVPLNLLEEWNKIRNNLTLLNSFEISRWVGMSDTASIELHGFCDASNSAYAAVAYLRVINEDGVHIELVAARTKVAPVKQVSTPRLELCGAVLLSKLLSEVSTVLSIPQKKLHAWTDSTIVLAWLKGEPTRWKTFVANRVTEILNVLNNDQWSHVQSGDNPADMASRGLTPEELINKQQFWMQGPQWLSENNIPFKEVSADTHLEEKKVKSHMVTAVMSSQPMTVWSKYSSFKKLIRVIAYCKRFISNLKNKIKHNSTYLTAKELEDAKTVCIKHCQASIFQDEINRLLKDKPLKKTSSVFSLCPFLDKDGVMRVRGRIQESMEEYDTKHPIILPYGHHISKLVVANAHEETLHGGPQLTLNYLRSKFWIINAKGLVRQHIKRCVRCIRYSSTHQNPFMGELPSSRVTISRPFSRSGVDYAGPVHIRMSKGRGCKGYKGYICLFVCMATKAIHLEAVTDLTSEGFLAAFKRFVARRGHCQEIWSDNGTNFVGAAKELRNLFKEDTTVMKEVAVSLADKGTEWHFIPPRTPNFGGLWESAVRSTKHHLKRVLDGSTLTYEELCTVLAQIEACLNSRPMYRLPEDQGESSPLTPGHFLIGEPLLTIPDNKYQNCPVSNLRRWQIMQKMVQQFWRKWSQEYLSTLQNRYKWTKFTPEPSIGDIVLVKEDDLPPSKWLFGRIETKHPGPDQITRVVTIKSKGSIFKRPVSKLCVLPVTD